MVDERSNLDYARDDVTNEEAGNLPKADYVTTDEITDVDTRRAIDMPAANGEIGEIDDGSDTELNPEASTYGAP